MDSESYVTIRIPKLKESVCGCSLNTGTKIIGIFSVVANLLIVIILSVVCGLYPSSDVDHDSVNLGIIIVDLLISICDLMVSVLLVMAVYTQRPSLAKPWLVERMISLFIDVALFVSALAVGNLRFAIAAPIGIGVGLYFWLVVYSYCQETQGEPLLGTNHDTERVEEGPVVGRYQM